MVLGQRHDNAVHHHLLLHYPLSLGSRGALSFPSENTDATSRARGSSVPCRGEKA